MVFEASGDVTIKVVDAVKDMPDVKDSDWFAGDVVDFATARGIVNGVDMPDGSKQFQGYGGTSRGMLVAMLHNLEMNPGPLVTRRCPMSPRTPSTPARPRGRWRRASCPASTCPTVPSSSRARPR